VERASVRVGIIAMLIGFALAGCGSSSKSSTSATTASITKADFVAKGNAICGTGNKQRNGAGKALGNNPSRAQVVNYVRKSFVPGIQSTIDQLRALGAPAVDRAAVTSMVNLAQSDLDKLKANPILIFNSPSLFHGFALKAHAYGLKQCARNA